MWLTNLAPDRAMVSVFWGGTGYCAYPSSAQYVLRCGEDQEGDRPDYRKRASPSPLWIATRFPQGVGEVDFSGY